MWPATQQRTCLWPFEVTQRRQAFWQSGSSARQRGEALVWSLVRSTVSSTPPVAWLRRALHKGAGCDDSENRPFPCRTPAGYAVLGVGRGPCGRELPCVAHGVAGGADLLCG